MRVLGVCSYAGLGGCERSFAILLEQLPPEAERSALLVGNGPLREQLAGKRISVGVARGFEGRPGPHDLGRFTRSLYEQLRRMRPDVVWASGQKAALLAIPACRLAGVPLVWHKVDFSWDRLLARPLALGSNGITVVSEAVARPIGMLARRRLLGVIAPPVPPGLVVNRRIDPAKPTIGTLGRLVPYKGHHRIIEAAAALRADFPELRVVIAGGRVPQYADYPARLHSLAGRLGLRDRLELPGFVEDLSGVLSRLNVFVSATYRDADGYGLEGRGRAIIEASSAGVPVVASRAGGAQESVIDGRTGTLVDDSQPCALAEAIRPYLRDPQMAKRAGDEGRSHARVAFDPEALGRLLYDRLSAVAA